MSGYDPRAPVHDAAAAHMTEDIPCYGELVREADGPVVELMLGSGRVAIPAVRAPELVYVARRPT